MSKNKLTHFDKNGNPSMVDINQKDLTVRVAIANGKIIMKPNTLKRILDFDIKKGDVLNVAKLAGIMAAKKTDQLIPLCHSIPLSYINVDLEPNIEESSINITAEASLIGKTGVEMEALTAVSVAGLTIYDMCKAIDREMILTNVKLIHNLEENLENSMQSDLLSLDEAINKIKSSFQKLVMKTFFLKMLWEGVLPNP